jgi:hypothetical protein
VQFYPTPCYFFPWRWNSSSEHPVLKHSEPTFFFSRGERPSFMSMQNNNRYLHVYIIHLLSRAIAVSHRLRTAAVQVRARSGHVGFVMDTVALGQVFSEYFGFPCLSSFNQILDPQNHPRKVQ